MVSIPLTVLLIFTLNILLAQFGAADTSGSGVKRSAHHPAARWTTVLVVAGAGSTHNYADLCPHHPQRGIDAMASSRPPSVGKGGLASMLVATLFNGLRSPPASVGGFRCLSAECCGALTATLT